MIIIEPRIVKQLFFKGSELLLKFCPQENLQEKSTESKENCEKVATYLDRSDVDTFIVLNTLLNSLEVQPEIMSNALVVVEEDRKNKILAIEAPTFGNNPQGQLEFIKWFFAYCSSYYPDEQFLGACKKYLKNIKSFFKFNKESSDYVALIADLVISVEKTLGVKGSNDLFGQDFPGRRIKVSGQLGRMGTDENDDYLEKNVREQIIGNVFDDGGLLYLNYYGRSKNKSETIEKLKSYYIAFGLPADKAHNLASNYQNGDVLKKVVNQEVSVKYLGIIKCLEFIPLRKELQRFKDYEGLKKFDQHYFELAKKSGIVQEFKSEEAAWNCLGGHSVNDAQALTDYEDYLERCLYAKAPTYSLFTLVFIQGQVLFTSDELKIIEELLRKLLALQYLQKHGTFADRIEPKEMSEDDFTNNLTLLGLQHKNPTEISKRDITMAYRKLAVLTHPDKVGPNDHFTKLNNAYNALLLEFQVRPRRTGKKVGHQEGEKQKLSALTLGEQNEPQVVSEQLITIAQEQASRLETKTFFSYKNGQKASDLRAAVKQCETDNTNDSLQGLLKILNRKRTHFSMREATSWNAVPKEYKDKLIKPESSSCFKTFRRK